MDRMLTNRTIVITGASRGLGRAFAEHLSARGARLGLIARDEHSLDHLCRSLSTEAIPQRCDVTDADQISAALEKIAEKLGGLDSVVANAGGLVTSRRAETYSPREWRDVLELNLTGAYLTARAAYPYLRASDSGRMVLVSSAAVKVSPRGSTAYVAAKAGVEALTRALSVEWANDGIRVNALAPGFMDHGESLMIKEETSNQVIDRTALRRPGQVNDLASVLTFMVSGQCDYMTGHIMAVDGGYGLA